MEKKRKLPARAAARVEQASKKRTMTPPQRSLTPASVPEPEPEPEPSPAADPPPLPKSITAGKPLPAVETPQPDDLSAKEWQSISESGVLAESLSRSRQKWITEGIFEKFWTKPTKRKGVVIEDSNNPPKDSMVKLGQVTITVEPHVFEATMYGVKDPKPPPVPPTDSRPVVLYGPPNGIMPPPPPPKPAPSKKVSTPTLAKSQHQPQPQPPPPTQSPAPNPNQPTAEAQSAPQNVSQQANPSTARDSPSSEPMVVPAAGRPLVASSPRGMESVLSPPVVAPHAPTQRPPPLTTPPTAPQPPRPSPSPSPHLMAGSHSMVPPGPPAGPGRPSGPPSASALGRPPAANGTPTAPITGAPGKPAPGTDPIILTLAEKAGEDPQLRDLMKRVAQGDAAKDELAKFQAIIDAITVESKRKGMMGPSADRLLVDGRTVRYFAHEVRAILDIVLSSKPNQTAADLRPPARSDPLVVTLVKRALDDNMVKDMVRRIADNKPQFADASDLKAILDDLRQKLLKEKEKQRTQSPVPATAATTPKSSSAPDKQPAATPAVATPTPQQPPPAQQALRSKGPPPPPKLDVSAVVFEFAGGTGDRYLFPKFSIIEYTTVTTGQQAVASFMIVRKGSKSEYPMADPDLDYYQPLTIRLFSPTGRHLENLTKVVAPREEVRRYMEDIMDKMTRAEYILLAMRLPRGEGKDEPGADEKEKEKESEPDSTGSKTGEIEAAKKTPQPGVLWAKPPKPEIRELPPRSRVYKMDVDDQYQSFISGVSRKEPKET
ncbi:hypothetical protein B0T26DRAFT_381773 [Lasiosphaeria miniovina]|uniref:SWR1-complex protein 3 domain-containing protein n=1 Tax=Lasiosphaeria miniovina TaxID=1954250 RepID=A0AA40DUS9_9PEZI|nr:uncharacterized protein B0T26DRAFT_381773 [Lasiosphaeria miniovina]KAK0713976.1 hypothetical protein B0T26DRAFT_381773 [Lasiosphaeria miniovina]